MNADSDTVQPIDVNGTADLKSVVESVSLNKPIDPEVARRVRERSERMSREVLERLGPLNVAVDLVREGRYEE